MKKKNNFNKKNIVVGVDGGGTKTDAWVADEHGKILSKNQGGSSNLRDIGIEESMFTVFKTTKKALLKINQKKVLSIFIGLPAFAEEYKKKENKIKKEFLKHSKKIFKFNKVFIGSDQEVAFKSGTDEKEGVVAIAGTGSSVRGWKGKKDIKCSGWGWLGDKGGAYWIGKRAYEETLKSLDGRSKKSILSNLIIKELKVKNAQDLNGIVYKNNFVKTLSQLSLLVEKSANKKDKIAVNILKEGSFELSLSVISVIKRLGFKKEFPLVLIGGMFKSKIFKNNFKKEIKKINSNALFVFPKEKPALGAVKLAKEKYLSIKNFSKQNK